jgi:hypothetical protein
MLEAGVQRIVGLRRPGSAAVDDQVLFCLKPLGTERLILAHLIRLAGRGKRITPLLMDYIGSRVVAPVAVSASSSLSQPAVRALPTDVMVRVSPVTTAKPFAVPSSPLH